MVQLWAAGWTNDGKSGIEVVSPGDVPMSEDRPKPRRLTEEEISGYIRDYTQSARLAIEAGFDGVELQAHGYLINQFLSSASNNRTDQWGGSVANRARFMLEIIKSTAAIIGAGRVGIRLAPYALFAGVYTEESPREHLEYIRMIREQSPDFGYVHMVEPRGDPAKLAGYANEFATHDVTETLAPFREQLTGTRIQFISSGGYSIELGEQTIAKFGGGVAYGRFFAANPDLPRRIFNGWPLQKYDRSTFYTSGPKGYTDYSLYEESVTAD